MQPPVEAVRRPPGRPRPPPLYCRTCEPTTRARVSLRDRRDPRPDPRHLPRHPELRRAAVQGPAAVDGAHPGADQYVLVDKLTPRFDTYKRGDIVVFTPPAAWGERRHAVHQARHRRAAATRSRSATTASSTSTAQPSTSRTSTRRGRRPAPADDGAAGPVELDHPRRRAVPDGRPPLQLGRLADVRAGRRSTTSSAAPGCATGRIDTFGILQTPTYPDLSTTTP